MDKQERIKATLEFLDRYNDKITCDCINLDQTYNIQSVYGECIALRHQSTFLYKLWRLLAHWDIVVLYRQESKWHFIGISVNYNDKVTNWVHV
jgi:hypothetical protein